MVPTPALDETHAYPPAPCRLLLLPWQSRSLGVVGPGCRNSSFLRVAAAVAQSPDRWDRESSRLGNPVTSMAQRTACRLVSSRSCRQLTRAKAVLFRCRTQSSAVHWLRAYRPDPYRLRSSASTEWRLSMRCHRWVEAPTMSPGQPLHFRSRALAQEVRWRYGVWGAQC